MKAVLELQKALTKNYYLEFLTPYEDEFEFDLFCQIIKYNGSIYIERQPDVIDDKRKIVIQEIKVLYNSAISEILIELAHFQNIIQKRDYLNKLIEVINRIVKQLKTDFYIDNNSSRYYLNTNFDELLSIDPYSVLHKDKSKILKFESEEKSISSFRLHVLIIRAKVISLIPFSLLTIANSFIIYLENQLDKLKNHSEVIEKPKSKLKLKTKVKLKSFTYINNLRGQSNLTDLKDSLIREKLISADTDLKDFRKVFSGESIDKPIVWIGRISELYYFILQLHDKLELVQYLKRKQWEVAVICFIQENGEQYNRTRLRSQKVPSTSKNIDSVLKTLK